MLLLLISTMLSTWRYAGFAADPAAPSPAPSVPETTRGDTEPPKPRKTEAVSAGAGPRDNGASVPASTEPVNSAPPLARLPLGPPAAPASADVPAKPDPPPVVVSPTPPPPPPPAPRPPRKPRTRRVEVTPPPSLWRLADLSGQVWEDPDADRLRQWVAYRNALLSAAAQRRAMTPTWTGLTRRSRRSAMSAYGNS